MADLVELARGPDPWQPTSDSELVVEYRHYDVPLTGVLGQHDREYLFMCLQGADEDLSLWWYVPITQAQRSRLEALPAEQFDGALRLEVFYGWSRLAFATELLGILDYEDAELSEDPVVAEQNTSAAITALVARLDGLTGQAHEMAAALA